MTGLDDRLREAAGSLAPDPEPVPPFKGVRQRARRRRMMGAAGAVVVLVAVTFAGVSLTRDRDKVIVANPRSTSTTIAPTTTTTAAVSTPVTHLTRVAVYLIANEHIVVAGRDVEGGPTPEAAARVLLAGPVGAAERDLGFTSAIPAGTVLHSVTVDGPVATVDLSAEFAVGVGWFAEQARVAQVVFTMTQFPGIDRVRFRIDGVPLSTTPEGVKVDNVDRADFANVTPAILVDYVPGPAVRAPLHVRGMSNTFEATVNYTLTDSSGAVLAEGYTTATAGNGTWGTFRLDVNFSVERAEPGRLSVYEISAEDGSRIHETSIPLELQP